MANHDSATKKHRQDEKKRMVNRINRSKMKNKIKALKKKVSVGESDEAVKMLPGDHLHHRHDRTQGHDPQEHRLTLQIQTARADQQKRKIVPAGWPFPAATFPTVRFAPTANVRKNTSSPTS